MSDYCPYTKNPGAKWSAPDMEKAKQLVEESGTKGQKVTIIAEDTRRLQVGRRLSAERAERARLSRPSVKPISSNIQFTYIQNTNNKVQMSITQWYQDYPAASDFLNILFGCDSFHEGSDSSVNIAGFCDKEIDAKMKKALDLGVDRSRQPPTRCGPRSTRRSPTRRRPPACSRRSMLDFVSKRVGNFQFNPQFTG